MYVAVEAVAGLRFIKPTSICYICGHWTSAAFKILHVWIIVKEQIKKRKKKKKEKVKKILAA